MARKIYIVIGGFTSKVGDPSYKVRIRPVQCNKSADPIIDTLRSIVRYFGLQSKVVFLNNANWLETLPLSTYIKIARSIQVQDMLSSDIYRRRFVLKRPIYLHEMLYQTLQAYDFMYLNKTRNVTIQIGGQDQWCNMLAGTEMIRKFTGTKAHVVTCKLLVDKHGVKIGKTSSGYLGLSNAKSPFMTFNEIKQISKHDITTYAACTGLGECTHEKFSNFIDKIIYYGRHYKTYKLMEKIVNNKSKFDIFMESDKKVLHTLSEYGHEISSTQWDEMSMLDIMKISHKTINSDNLNQYILQNKVMINGRNLRKRADYPIIKDNSNFIVLMAGKQVSFVYKTGCF